MGGVVGTKNNSFKLISAKEEIQKGVDENAFSFTAFLSLLIFHTSRQIYEVTCPVVNDQSIPLIKLIHWSKVILKPFELSTQ